MTYHDDCVRLFMERSGQEVPINIQLPDEETRLARARLILEEALETINALGFHVRVWTPSTGPTISKNNTEFLAVLQPDLEEILDGCGDLRVVSTGTMLACGTDPDSVQVAIDHANLRKHDPPTCEECGNPMLRMKGGNWECHACGLVYAKEQVGGYKDEKGKWIKPWDFEPPNIKAVARPVPYKP